ncbi:MAG: TylF/MycF family methyltransferase, partial [Actinomycetota bacterium]|nr:TylF/MycF family methyltransferase [Actinomycetota bacterium]
RVSVLGDQLKRVKYRLYPTVQELAYLLRLRAFFYRYEYMFSPRQLCFLCSSVSEVRDVEGSVVEIGCAFGHTAVFLNEHMDHEGIDKRYVCVDTFSGFTPSDVAFERQIRGKNVEGLDVFFSTNKRKWFEFTLDINGIDRAEVIEADIAALDIAQLGPVAFCLIDVDLYLPVRAALTGVFDILSPGGMIVVDDCFDHQLYDGAYHAYTEFTAAQGLPTTVVLGKLGVIRKATPVQQAIAPSAAEP